jgi:hypothetical protein
LFLGGETNLTERQERKKVNTYIVKIGSDSYRVNAKSQEQAERLVRLKFKIDGRRAAWTRQVRAYNFK